MPITKPKRTKTAASIALTWVEFKMLAWNGLCHIFWWNVGGLSPPQRHPAIGSFKVLAQIERSCCYSSSSTCRPLIQLSRRVFLRGFYCGFVGQEMVLFREVKYKGLELVGWILYGFPHSSGADTWILFICFALIYFSFA